VLVEIDQRKGRQQPLVILLQAAITHFVNPKTHFRMRKGHSTFERTLALVRFLLRSTSSTPPLCLARREVISCAAGAAA